MSKKSVLVMSALALAISSNVALAAKAADKKSADSSGDLTSFIDGLDKTFEVTSNYVWRGLSQGGSAPAVQGGATYKHDSGISVGLWLSSSASTSTGGSNEYDVTISYGSKTDKFGYEAGVVSYSYPQQDGGGAHEIFGGIKVNDMNAYLYVNPDSASGDNMYIELSSDIGKKLNIALGVNSNDFAAADYNQVTLKAKLSKQLTLAVSQTDLDGDDTELALTYKMAIK